MKQTIKDNWITALRSGDYKQGPGVLKTKDNRYCCLGVLCDIDDRIEWQNGVSSRGYGAIIPEQDDDAGFYTLYHKARELLGLSDNDSMHLMQMNDATQGYVNNQQSFAQIAQWIEDNL